MTWQGLEIELTHPHPLIRSSESYPLYIQGSPPKTHTILNCSFFITNKVEHSLPVSVSIIYFYKLLFHGLFHFLKFIDLLLLYKSSLYILNALCYICNKYFLPFGHLCFMVSSVVQCILSHLLEILLTFSFIISVFFALLRKVLPT